MSPVPQASLHDKLINYLKKESIDYEEIEHRETKTSAESAAARGTKLEQGAKALLMMADSNPVLLILSAAKKANNTAVKKMLGAEDLRMATPEEVRQISGVGIGAVPPFGNLFKTPVYVDESFLSVVDIAFNSGSLTQSVIMKSSDFIKLVKPKVGVYGI